MGRAGLRVATAGEASRMEGAGSGERKALRGSRGGRLERSGGPNRQSAVLRRRDEIATRNDVARFDIRASTVTRYKNYTRLALRIR